MAGAFDLHAIALPPHHVMALASLGFDDSSPKDSRREIVDEKDRIESRGNNLCHAMFFFIDFCLVELWRLVETLIAS